MGEGQRENFLIISLNTRVGGRRGKARVEEDSQVSALMDWWLVALVMGITHNQEEEGLEEKILSLMLIPPREPQIACSPRQLKCNWRKGHNKYDLKPSARNREKQ